MGQRSIEEYLRNTSHDAVESLVELLSTPGISTDPNHRNDVCRSGRWVESYLSKLGMRTEWWETPECPAVFAEWTGAGPDAPTVLIYGHHDVQPTGDLARWTSPPFEPRVDASGRIFARGAADNKGQFFLQMRAVEACLRTTGRLPVNVKILIEGEEEIGSPNLGPLLERNRDKLKCDVVVVSDTPLWKPDHPAISLGTRGITGLEVRVTTAERDLHSGIFGGSEPNAIAVLTRMLASLHDDSGRVAVPGFYDQVLPIPDDLRQAWNQLRPTSRGTGESGFNVLEQRWLRPTVELNGITGGYQGPGSNTIIPCTASAKITCRLVPDQLPDAIQSLLRDHLTGICPPDAKVDFALRKTGAAPYTISRDHPGIRAAARVLREVYGVDPVVVREGLSLPILPMFKTILGADTLLLGFCDPDCNAHSFDEFFDSKDLLRGSIAAARFLEAYANT